MSSYEEDIIAKHGDARLKRSELDRSAKKDHLNGQKVDPIARDLILDKMYGPESKNENS